MLPTICCLCPTYGRPKLLKNAVACFLAQKYDHQRCCLFINDDLGTISPEISPSIFGMYDSIYLPRPGVRSRWHRRIEVHSSTQRYPSLPEKYNETWRLAPQADIYLVWEDDDCQLPWCLMTHAQALEHKAWSQPSEVWSDYGERLHTEPTGGRFHGSLGFRAETLCEMNGWVQTRRADFDQMFMAELRRRYGEPGNPMFYSPIKTPDQLRANPDSAMGSSPYVFRWQHGFMHGQTQMRGPEDTDWYDRYQPPDRSGPHAVQPIMDEQTRQFYRVLAGVGD